MVWPLTAGRSDVSFSCSVSCLDLNLDLFLSASTHPLAKDRLGLLSFSLKACKRVETCKINQIRGLAGKANGIIWPNFNVSPNCWCAELTNNPSRLSHCYNCGLDNCLSLAFSRCCVSHFPQPGIPVVGKVITWLTLEDVGVKRELESLYSLLEPSLPKKQKQKKYKKSQGLLLTSTGRKREIRSRGPSLCCTNIPQDWANEVAARKEAARTKRICRKTKCILQKCSRTSAASFFEAFLRTRGFSKNENIE